jgi:hypothetical protein
MTRKWRLVWRALKKTLPAPRLIRMLTTVLLVTTAALSLASVGISYHYAEHRTTVRQPEVGRIYPLNTHGWIVYLTKEEQDRLTALQTAAFVTGLLCVCLGVLQSWRFDQE